MTLDDYCAELKNYFISYNPKQAIHTGEYTIVDSDIDVDFLDSDQYFRIVGSKFNDGVYKFDEHLVLEDEVFDGAIWAMAVPPDFLKAVKDSEDYLTAHPMGLEYQSESFGGYSYTRASNNKLLSGSFSYLPKTIANRLNRYRRLRII